jgi:chitodextrinase
VFALAAKRTALAAASLTALAALSILVPTGGASSDRRDKQAPTTPLNLRVVAATPSLVSIAWDPSVDDAGVAGYYVFGDKGKAIVDTPMYIVRDLKCGESTVVNVIAFDEAQNRSERATLTVSTAACPDTQPPTPPSGFTQLSTTRDAVVLGWNPSSDNTRVVEYGVYRDLQRVATAAEPDVALAGLACGSTYAYAVDAADASGNRSPRSSVYVRTTSCATPPAADTTPPSTPTGLAASGVTQTDLALSWNASSDNVGVVGYDVYRNGAKVASPTSTNLNQSSLACGSSYAFALAARDAAGNTSNQTQLSVSTSACSAPPPPAADTTPPSTPTGLAASGVTQTGLALSWNASSDNVGVVGYDVYRNGAKVASPTSTNLNQSSLACGSTYAFAVAARDAAGNTSNQAQLSVSTSACSPPADTTSPSTPSGLGVSGATSTSVSLRWTASTDNVGVAGYRVYVNSAYSTTTAQLAATVSGLACGSAYVFQVDAFDLEGNGSARASVTASTAACADTQAPSAPLNVAATSRTATSIALAWSASTDNVGVTGYGLYRAGSQVATTSLTNAIFSGLACNTNYTLAVDAVDAAGNRSSQTIVLVSTTACPDTSPPSAPSGLAASNVAATSLTLTWNASSDNVGVAGYDVYRNGTKMATTTSSSSSQTGLACATGYAFGVEAFDVAGNRSTRTQLSATTAACTAPPPPATNVYYVDANGSDSGDGSQSRPWKTIARAASSTPGNAGNTIHVNPGTYVESSTVSLPCKTNLQGSGGRNGLTTVKGSADPLISISNCLDSANSQTISGLKLDGQNRSAGAHGLRAIQTRGLTLSDLDVESFKGVPNAGGGAIEIANGWNLELKDSVLRNSAGVGSDSCGGTLGLGNLDDAKIHDVTISEDRGYGIKTSITNDGFNPAPSYIRNSDLYNLDVQTTSANCSKWSTLTVELYETDPVNSEIRNSRFNGTLSLTDAGSGSPLSSGYRWRLHNNVWTITPGMYYAIELDQNSCEVDHNYFNGGSYPIAHFGTDVKSGNIVHHNVFDNNQNPTAAWHFVGGARDSQFYKNTVIMRESSWRDGVFSLAEAGFTSSTIAIRDNVFDSTYALGDKLGTGLGSASVDHNAFYNIAPRGANSVAANPQLPLSGGFPSAYVAPAGSPAASMGAFADGNWSVGPS